MVRILVVDDDPNIRSLLSLYLQKEGYQPFEASQGEEALALLEKIKVDLIVLDIMMPTMDGWTFCENIKSVYDDLPIIMLTAKGEPTHRIHGFELGSDDYVVKPFEPRELMFRIKALLRRYQINSSQSITFGQMIIDQKNYEIRCDEEIFVFPPKEFEILFKLASSPGQIFTREQLIEALWGIDYQGDERTVDVHVKRLRDRLGERFPVRITTVRGLGYRLEVIG